MTAVFALIMHMTPVKNAQEIEGWKDLCQIGASVKNVSNKPQKFCKQPTLSTLRASFEGVANMNQGRDVDFMHRQLRADDCRTLKPGETFEIGDTVSIQQNKADYRLSCGYTEAYGPVKAGKQTLVLAAIDGSTQLASATLKQDITLPDFCQATK